MSSENQIQDIETHIEMILTDEMKNHCGFCESDELHMQIFRILQGHNKAIEQTKSLLSAG